MIDYYAMMIKALAKSHNQQSKAYIFLHIDHAINAHKHRKMCQTLTLFPMHFRKLEKKVRPFAQDALMCM